MASKDDQEKSPHTQEDEAPDPDEDDLDDLDDVLDEFSAAKISPQPAAATTSQTTDPGPSGPGRPAQDDSDSKDATAQAPQPAQAGEAQSSEEADFAAQLQTGMAEMMRELESNPEMAKQFEQMMAQFGAPPGTEPAVNAAQQQPTAAPKAGSAPTPSASPTDKPAASTAPDANFQNTIKQTMDRMRTSNDTATTAAGSDPSGEDMMSALLSSMAASNSGGAGAAGGEDPDALSSMLLSMMEQLTNKEILYEPMKELDTKFPAWLDARKPGNEDANTPTLSEEERARFTDQAGLVHEIVARFERSGYSDTNAADREFIVERMQKMQAMGAPPPELVGDMGPAGDMLAGGDTDAGCPQQ